MIISYTSYVNFMKSRCRNIELLFLNFIFNMERTTEIRKDVNFKLKSYAIN